MQVGLTVVKGSPESVSVSILVSMVTVLSMEILLVAVVTMDSTPWKAVAKVSRVSGKSVVGVMQSLVAQNAVAMVTGSVVVVSKEASWVSRVVVSVSLSV